MSNTIKISGGVVAEPELKVISERATVLSFPLYDSERRKNKDSQDYEETGNVLKLRVQLWNDVAKEWNGKIHKGDIVELEGTITEREYDKQDGTKGRSLETTFVNSIKVKWSKAAQGQTADAGFIPAPTATTTAANGGW